MYSSARIDVSDARVGQKKRALRSNQETGEGKRCAVLAHSLTKKGPYKGPSADSGEKREPVGDIDIAVVGSLKVLDPKRPIREADMASIAASTATERQSARTKHGDVRPAK